MARPPRLTLFPYASLLPIWGEPLGEVVRALVQRAPAERLELPRRRERGRDALPRQRRRVVHAGVGVEAGLESRRGLLERRSEEHTSELQSRQYLVCRPLLEQ